MLNPKLTDQKTVIQKGGNQRIGKAKYRWKSDAKIVTKDKKGGELGTYLKNRESIQMYQTHN